MANKKIKDEASLEQGWKEAQVLRTTLKSGVRDDIESQSFVDRLRRSFRESPLFTRRKSKSLVNRIVWLLLSWSLVIYLLGVTGLWWSSNKVIEDNFSQQASDWIDKLDEMGTPLYAANDEFLFHAIEEHVRGFPEIYYLRYYDANTNQVIASYVSRKLGDVKIPELSPEIINKVRLNIDSNMPVSIRTADKKLSLVQVASPIVTRSIRTDELMNMDLELNSIETIKIIGYLELGLDFSYYRSKLLENIIIGSLAVALLLFGAAILGRFLIKRSLLPLTNMRKPLELLASGNTDVHVDGEGDEEIVAIANALNTTIDALRSRDEKLRKLANYDELTGLLNKHNFNLQLKQEVQRTIDENDTSALLFIDLDQFKHVNDNLGHAAGDRLLQQVAELLKKRIRSDDVIARFGGDEFTIIAKSINVENARTVAESLLEAMQQFVFIESGQAFSIYCSIGVVLIDNAGFTAEEIFSQADISCFHAKSEGRNRYHMFDLSEQEELRKNADINWSKRIGDAIKNNYFALYFQPIVGVSGDQTEHYEVLLRMLIDGEELIQPNAFLPAAERLGVAINIDHWVVQNALLKLSEFEAEGRDVYFSINLSARVFEEQDIVEKIQNYIAEYKVNPQHIIFEVTEQTAVGHIDKATEVIIELKKMGCRFALDDFGVGFSSFNYLKRLPVDFLKIDGDFVSDMANDPVDQAMVQSIIQIARTLKKQTIAEYVKDAATLELLKKFGVDFVQGFYLGEPVNNATQEGFNGALKKVNAKIVKLKNPYL